MVNAVNSADINYSNYNNNINTTNPLVEDSLFVTKTNEYNDDTFEKEENIESSEQTETREEITSVEDLEAKFEEIQAKQGFVGKTFDKIKNALPFLSKLGCKGSEEVQDAIEKVKSGEMTLEEAKEIIEKYESNQEIGTEVILDTATLGIVSAVCLLAGPLGWGALAVIGVSTAVGAVSRVALGAADAATNDVEGDYTAENIKEDAVKGGIIGFLKGLGKVIGCKFKMPKETDKDKIDLAIKSSMSIANLFKATPSI